MSGTVVYFAPHTRALRIFWLLEELGLPYEPRAVAFPPRDNAPDYLASVNPSGTLPTVIDGDVVFTESMAACEHLAAKAGSDLVIPPGHAERADYLQWLWFGESTLMVPVSVRVRVARLPKDPAFLPLVEDAKSTFAARLAPLDARLEGREFLVAGRLTLADISCFYPLYIATLLRQPLTPASQAYFDRLKARPAFARAADVE